MAKPRVVKATPKQFASKCLTRGILLACQKCLTALVAQERYLRCTNPKCGQNLRVPRVA